MFFLSSDSIIWISLVFLPTHWFCLHYCSRGLELTRKTFQHLVQILVDNPWTPLDSLQIKHRSSSMCHTFLLGWIYFPLLSSLKILRNTNILFMVTKKLTTTDLPCFWGSLQLALKVTPKNKVSTIKQTTYVVDYPMNDYNYYLAFDILHSVFHCKLHRSIFHWILSGRNLHHNLYYLVQSLGCP